MLKRYFVKCIFTDAGGPFLAEEVEIDETLIPLNEEVVRSMIQAMIRRAAECGIKIEVTLWVEHEDGSQEEIHLSDELE